jgi:hypothetical protein
LDFRHDAALQGSAPRKARERLSQKKTQFARTEDLDSIYSINPMAAQIWDLLDGQRTLGDIRDLLLQDYNVTPAELDRDIAEFVEQLMSEKLIREA